MEQKYEVFVEGKPVRFGAQEAIEGLPATWSVRRITAGEEVPVLLEPLALPEVEVLLLVGETPELAFAEFRTFFTPVVAAGGAVSDERSRLLVIKRLGVWDLPKGKVDKGETVQHAALREVREECGVQGLELGALLCETWHTYERKGRHHLKCTHWFAMTANSREQLLPQAEEGIEEVRWAEVDEIDAIARLSYASLAPVFTAWAEEHRRRT